MQIVEVIYKRKTATISDILVHLKECNDNFYPPLAQRVDLEVYARKIFENAVTFEAWREDVLVGLVAIYFNEELNCFGYITSVSVLDAFLRSGIASRLLKQCIEYAVDQKAREVRLEVHEKDQPAIYMYRKLGFALDGDGDGFLKMKLMLPSG
jgi:ribosomal protein S18 acetylase RimI-like enzyme